MLRRGRGKSKTNTQEIQINRKKTALSVLALLVISLGLLFTFGANPASGDDGKQKAKVIKKQLKSQRNQTKRWVAKADRWAHKRNKHVRHKSYKVTWNLAKEKRRTAVWKKQAFRQKKLTKKWKRTHSIRIKLCVRAGFPRSLCPDLIKAAKAEGLISWSHDSNLAWIMRHESGFSPNAQNPSSSAYGLFQFLNTTWSGTGISKSADPYWQSRAGLRYVKRRYGTPAGAVSWWRSHNWY